VKKTLYEMVAEFQRKFGFEYSYEPRYIGVEEKYQKYDHMLEELNEFKNADTIEDQFDALIDLVYVALGTAYRMGLPFEEGFRLVHEANMEKVRGVTHRGHTADVAKPEGWKAADLKSILKAME